MSVGFPASAKLNQWAFAVSKVFGGHCYLVGSALIGKSTRDVDVVCIVDDGLFQYWCPKSDERHGELDWRWSGLCIAFSEWGKSATGLNIDFKLQSQTYANERHPKGRSFIGGIIGPGLYFKDGEWHEYDEHVPSSEEAEQIIQESGMDFDKFSERLDKDLAACLGEKPPTPDDDVASRPGATVEPKAERA